MRLRELGLTSLGSAARIQLKAQTPPKGHFWLRVVILSQAIETSVSYICLLVQHGDHGDLAPLALRCTGIHPKQGSGGPNAGNTKCKHLHKATRKMCEILQQPQSTEILLQEML